MLVARAARVLIRTPRAAPVASFSSSSSVASASAPAPAKPAVKKAARVTSSCQAGTSMPGLGVFKDQPDPVALPDDQYPAWLWTILEKPSAKGAEGEVDFKAERKRLRAQNRTNIKSTNFLKTT